VSYTLLLVHDDLATIALVRRTLVRAGHTVELATSTADALTAATTLQPALILLAPGVESGRGAALLHELIGRPETVRLRILLLGRMVDGHRGSVLPTPFRAETLLHAVDEALAADPPADEPVTDMFGTSSHLSLDTGPETLDLDWEPATGPMSVTGSDPVLDPAELQAVPEPALPADPPEAFDAGPLLEGEPELEPEHAGEDELLHAAEEGTAPLHSVSPELEHTSPEVAVAAGAWSAATDDRLAPKGAGPGASALLEDIASEARAREEQVRAAQQAVEESQRLRSEAEALAENRARDAREASATALAARIDADDARTQAEAARADAAAARAEAESTRADARAARAEAEAARLDAEAARTAHAAAEDARAEVERALFDERHRSFTVRQEIASAQATGAAEAELLATSLRAAEARAEAETNARLMLEARSQEELERLRAALAEATGANAALSEATQSLEREAADLAGRLAAEEAASAESRRQAEAWLQSERDQADALRRELLELKTGRIAQESAALAEAEQRVSAAVDEASQLREALERAQAETDQVRLESDRRARADEERRDAEARAHAEAAAAEDARRAAERARWAVADAGRVTLEDLAGLLFRLEEGRATARLELRAADALRVVWIEEGTVSAAASTVSTESLLDHALRDGLLDGAAERELRILRLGEPELLEELLRRKLVTDAELVPFLQRVTEARALEAFSEPVSFYRLSPDTPPPDGRRAAVRSLSALAAEGVRRGLPADEVDRLVPSMRAVPKLLRRVDPTGLGLGERERRLLEVIDGRHTVQQLLLSAGVSRDGGRKAVAVAVVLGWIELQPPSQQDAQAETVEVAAARLEARWAQVEDADYFTVLGLPRNAGTDEVTRAFARLSAEYDPLRWSGHPDPRVQVRAERMQALLSEAARALSDDGLRSAYARSLE
jgi:CheY-like chemotaxis protein